MGSRGSRPPGARTIGIDLLFFEAEPSAIPEVWRDRLRQALGDLGSFLDNLSGDAELAGQMRAAGNVVLPYVVPLRWAGRCERAAACPPPWRRPLFESCTGRTLPPRCSLCRRPACSRRSPSSPRRRPPSATPTGRRATSFRPCAYGDDIYPSFALEVARQHLGVPRDDVRLELGRGVWLGDRLVPTDDRTQFVVNYRGHRSFSDA